MWLAPLVLTLSLVAQPAPESVSPTLDALFKRAASHLVFSVPPERRQYARYLSLHGIAPSDRTQFLAALVGAINGSHFKSRLYRPTLIDEGYLLYLDTSALGWDVNSRTNAIRSLRKLGIEFKFANADVESNFVNIWEDMAGLSPYFTDDQVNPVFAAWVAKVSYSKRFILAAHWLYPRLLLERQDNGFYSQLLLLPPVEADLYKRLGVPAEFIDLEPSAKHGGAVVDASYVAYNPRELQLIPSGTGSDAPYLWRTLDFLKVVNDAQDVRRSLGGTAKHDGREILFSLPSGLQGGYLANGQGKQVNFVPQAIAEDQRVAGGADDDDGASIQITSRTVFNYAKCIDCHYSKGNDGIIGFDDQVRPLMTANNNRLAYSVTKTKDVDAAIVEAERVEEFYGADINSRIKVQRAFLAARVLQATGLSMEAYRQAVCTFFNLYNAAFRPGLVTPEMAARELTLPLPVARALWQASGDSQLNFLVAGQPVTRVRWEQSLNRTFRPHIKPR